MVEHVWSRLLAGHPDLERLIHVRTKAWRQRPLRALLAGDLARPIREMRAWGADVAIDLMGNHKGALLARLSGARRVIGARRADRREGSSASFIGEPVATAGTHAVDRALSLLSALDIDPASEPVDFGGAKLLTDVPQAAAQWRARLDADRPVVSLLLGAGWANKIYPAGRWGEVTVALDAAGYDVWLPTAPGEHVLAEATRSASGGRARIVDATDFALLAAILRHSSLVLGGDTGPLHLAHALGAPVVSIIGPTDPRRNGPYDGPYDGPYLDSASVIFQPLPCSYCYKRFDGPRACLLSIPSRRVIDHALARLESS